MIRFANSQDIPEIMQLWKQCFSDEGGFDAYFFKHIFVAEQTLLLIENGMLCAMLQMFPYQLEISNVLEEITYIYGACTAPSMRKRGYMAQLLQYSFNLDQEEGRAASILIPQEEWLFGFYKKFGYEPAFYTSESTFVISAMPKYHSEDRCKPFVLGDSDIPLISNLYEKQVSPLNCFVKRSPAWWKQQIAMFQSLEGEAWGISVCGELKATAFVWKTGDNIRIQELISSEDQYQTLLCTALCQKYNCHSMRVTKPGSSRALGCAKFYDHRPAVRGYINLMFN